MTQFIHKTNNTNASVPLSSEIQEGEICLNTANIGSSSNGINNGRLYIKTNAGEVRRFISLGLSNSVDPALKVKYGGTNNTFTDLTSVTANTDGGDSVITITRDSNGNHVINRTPTNKLTWHSGNSRLNINRSSSAASTLHVGGDVAIDTITDRTTSFDSNFYILGSFNSAGTNNLRRILSTDFASYFPNSSIPIAKLSGSIPLNDDSVSSAKISGLIALDKGGTNNTFSTATDGSIVYYSGQILTHSNSFRYDGLTSTFILGGNFEFDPPDDVSNDAAPIGVDGTDKIVRMDYTYNQNLRTDSSVEFSKLSLTALSAADNFVIENIYDEAGAKFLGINSDGEVVRIGSSFSTDQDLQTTSNITFNKLIINNSLAATDAIVVNNMPVSSVSSDKIVVLDGSNYLRRTDYSIDQNIRTTDTVEFNKLSLSAFGTDALTITNIQTDATASIIGVNASNEIVEVGYSINQNLRTSDNVNFDKITIAGGTGSGDTLVLTSIQSSTGGVALEIDGGGNVYKSSSTRRLKENIVDYDKGLDVVLSMTPKYFNMINDPDKMLRAGLIAEDLADLGLNEFVTKDEHDNPIGISYDKLVVILINAIKELKNRLDNISSN